MPNWRKLQVRTLPNAWPRPLQNALPPASRALKKNRRQRVEEPKPIHMVFRDNQTQNALAVQSTNLKRKRHLRQIIARKYYESNTIQGLASFLIFGNFLINCFEAQTSPEPGGFVAGVLNNLDYVFTIIFTIELVWNAYSSWFSQFVSSLWNIFDTSIIAVSIAGLAGGMPQGLTVLRALRAVRVFRLFRRLDPLKQILISLG